MKTFNEISEIITNRLEQINWNMHPKGLYQPIDYVLSMGGKRIRPVLTLLACNLFTDDIEPAIDPALGIEIFHNFTLLHDDIMDRADVRRGKMTVHKKWNDNTAILSGDVMQITAYKYIANAPAMQLKQTLDLFSKTAAEICEGQQYDVEFENQDDVLAEQYLEMIRLKTAVLLGCALQIGAWIGGADNKTAQLLYDFGINVGLAFQLKDDLLDVYGNEESFGKKIGGDILCNKKTYLLIHALKLAKNETANDLENWLKNSDPSQENEKIAGVTAIFDKLGVKDICENKMQEYGNKAIGLLDEVEIENDKKQELRNLADKLLYRKD